MLCCISGGTAVGGLRATTPVGVGVENVMCPSNATSPAECAAIAPPEMPRCFGNSSAAGVRCTQGMHRFISYRRSGNFRVIKLS